MVNPRQIQLVVVLTLIEVAALVYLTGNILHLGPHAVTASACLACLSSATYVYTTTPPSMVERRKGARTLAGVFLGLFLAYLVAALLWQS